MKPWKILMTPRARLEFRNLLLNKLLSSEDLACIHSWMDDMEEVGPTGIAESKRWDDHALHSEWDGFRASCFSPSGRIIYRIKGNQIIIEVHRVTKDHNYRR